MIKIESTVKETFDAEKTLHESHIDTCKEYDRPPVILSIREQHATQWVQRYILTSGNFSVIKGKKKALKTALLALLVGKLCRPANQMDLIIPNLPENKKLVLYFDTEQSKYRSWETYRMIESISGMRENFKGFNLRTYSPMQRCDIIDAALKLWGDQIIFIAIDGVRDLVMAINDELEATRVSGLYLKWTADYDCHICTIIHENKATQDSRGFIGSEIENKAEVIITTSLIKGSYKSCDVQCTASRHIPFEPFVLTKDVDGIPYIDGETPTSQQQKESFVLPDDNPF